MQAIVESVDEEDLRGPPPAKDAFSPIDRRVSAPSTPAFTPNASFGSPKMPTPSSAKQALLERLALHNKEADEMHAELGALRRVAAEVRTARNEHAVALELLGEKQEELDAKQEEFDALKRS